METNPNTEVREWLGMKRKPLKEIKSRQIKHFGHIKIHYTLLKTLKEGKVEGRRARGRLDTNGKTTSRDGRTGVSVARN